MKLFDELKKRLLESNEKESKYFNYNLDSIMNSIGKAYCEITNTPSVYVDESSSALTGGAYSTCFYDVKKSKGGVSDVLFTFSVLDDRNLLIKELSTPLHIETTELDCFVSVSSKNKISVNDDNFKIKIIEDIINSSMDDI